MAAYNEAVRDYYRLTKPGIIYGNLITAGAGFLLAIGQGHHFNPWLLLETLAGISLVIASACAINNYIDRDIDSKMARTSRRAIPAGKISGPAAITYAAALGAAGFVVLALFVNWLVFGLGLVAFVSYVVLYGWGKRRSVHGTLIGSIPGATPPVAGYLAVTDHIDTASVILFFILVFWQMPHFYAIAMYRFKDYRAAGLPVLPVKKGMEAAKNQILAYVAAFTVAASLLTVFGYTGYVYLAGVLALGFYWLRIGLSRLKSMDRAKWGRKMFLTSLIVNLGVAVFIAVGAWLP